MKINIINEGTRGTEMGHPNKNGVVSKIHTLNLIVIKHLETLT